MYIYIYIYMYILIFGRASPGQDAELLHGDERVAAFCMCMCMCNMYIIVYSM